MTRIHEVKTRQTIATLHHLRKTGAEKISVLLRHSEKFFTEDAGMEPFMGLTDNGKAFAVEFGSLLDTDTVPLLYSSFMGRCIETAYLIDKGFSKKHHQTLNHNCVDKMLSPFYVKNIDEVVRQAENNGSEKFLRNWFDHSIDENIIENPEKTSDRITRFMLDRLKTLDKNQIAICVSHDWNMFAVKEFKLNLQLETSGDVGFLEGIFFFEKDNRTYISNYQTDPVEL